MNYVNKYILPFSNNLGEFYEIYFDFLNWLGGTVTQLTGTGDCLSLRSTSGDETKLTYILGTEALIKINVPKDSTITIADLIAEHDNDIRITIYKDRDYTKSIFQGFIVVEDNNQPFLDPPFVLQVRALDGLGLLKGVDLVDTDGNPFTGSQSIIGWLAQILHKTGQTLNIRTFFNFYNSSYSESISPLIETQLNAITFQKAVNPPTTDPSIDNNALNADDCYSAVEKICRNFRCRLFQEDGVWMLVNLYEYLNPDGYTFYEFELLAPIDGIVPASTVAVGNNKKYLSPVGGREIIHPTHDDANLFLKLATKFIKLTYSYDQSLNKICNQDFVQGDRNATYDSNISSTIIDPTITPTVTLATQGYDAFCWTHKDGPFSALAPPAKNAFIRSVVDSLGYETQRFAVIETNATTVGLLINNKTFLVDSGDRLSISLEWRLKNQFNPGGFVVVGAMYILFTGIDGSFWFLTGQTSFTGETAGGNTQWVATDSVFSTANPLSYIGNDNNTWHNITAGAASAMTDLKEGILVPLSGSIQIIISGQNIGVGNEAWYKNISITVLSYLNGSYKELKGDYNFSSSNNNIKLSVSDNVEISDSPKRYFKGALLNQDGLSLSPTSWHRKGKTESFRFTQGMERVMYNHLFRIVQKIEGTFRGLTYEDNDDLSVTKQAGYLNTYYFVDSDTPDKKYILTSFEKNYGQGEGRCVFVETLKDANDDGWANPDNYKFSYIFQ